MQIRAVNELVLQGLAAQSVLPYDTHTHTSIPTTVGIYSLNLKGIVMPHTALLPDRSRVSIMCLYGVLHVPPMSMWASSVRL